MIPKKTTPIKHEILIDIIAKGLLSLVEIRIVSWVMRYSWGFDHGKRRRDWTHKTTKTAIAREIEMARTKVTRTINALVNDNILLEKDEHYQFNEHSETWLHRDKKAHVTKSNTVTKRHGNSDESALNSDKKAHSNESGLSETKPPRTVKKGIKKERKGPSGFDKFKTVKAEEEDLVSRALRYLEKKEQYGKIQDKNLKNALSKIPKHLHHHIRKWLDLRYDGKHSYLKIKEALRKEGQ